MTSGTAPLRTYFSLSTELPNPVVEYQIDFDGDGVVDYRGTSFDDISHTYMSEGIFYPTVTVTDEQGNTYTDSLAITVLNKAEIGALLRSKWEAMRRALVQGKINEALSYFSKSSWDEYTEIFQLLVQQLPILVSEMRDISMTCVTGNVAEYYIRRVQQGVEMSYFIYFTKDDSGVWKIERF
jgi:hypothetical protein